MSRTLNVHYLYIAKQKLLFLMSKTIFLSMICRAPIFDLENVLIILLYLVV